MGVGVVSRGGWREWSMVRVVSVGAAGAPDVRVRSALPGLPLRAQAMARLWEGEGEGEGGGDGEGLTKRMAGGRTQRCVVKIVFENHLLSF